MDGLLRLPTPIVDAAMSWAVETMLVVSVLTAVAFLGDRWRRPRLGPTARHALWLVILVKLLTPPVLQWPWSRPWALNVSAPTTAFAASDSAPVAVAIRTNPADELAEASVAAAPPVFMRATMTALDLQPSVEISPGRNFPRARHECQDAPALLDRDRASDTLGGTIDLGGACVVVWALGSLLVAGLQGWRIGRFRRRVKSAQPAPDWLVEEAERIATYLGVRCPALGVVAGLASPVLWCLGRPTLLIPESLVKSLTSEGWRCVVTHELAHLRRGDQWVSRLELLAGIAWWWSPLYWWVRQRIDAEAELACDAWVVATLPKDRLSYAESLVRICTDLSLARVPAPSVGVAGSSRFFERRLTMILKDRVSCRLSSPAALAAVALFVLALPTWTSATPVLSAAVDFTPSAAPLASADIVLASVDLDDDEKAAPRDDNQDDEKAVKDAKKDKAKVKAERDARAEVRDKARAARNKAREDSGWAGKSEVEKTVRDALGPDFEKKMAEMGEKLAKDIEAKFGPEFEKQMKGLGKEMEGKFGPGSDFEKKMKALGKEMELKFGPGSDFEKEMAKMGERIAKEVEGKFAPGSDLPKKMAEVKAKVEAAKAKAKEKPVAEPKARAKASADARERRMKALEARIRAMTDELKKLQADDKEDDEPAESIEAQPRGAAKP